MRIKVTFSDELKTLGKAPEEMVDILESWLHERDIAQDQYDEGGGI